MRKLFLAVFILIFMTLSVGAQEWNLEAYREGSRAEYLGYPRTYFWFAELSVLFFPEKNGLASDPMPILPSPGAGFSFPVANIFRLELTLDFYMTHYGFDYTLNRAVPVAIENRSARVLGSLLGFHAAAYFNVNSLLRIRVFGGPAADLRIVVMAAGLNAGDKSDAKMQTDSVRSYFWSSGRWFMPVMGAGLDFNITDHFKVGMDMRIWAPIYRIWTGEKLPAIEGWRFSPGIRFSFL